MVGPTQRVRRVLAIAISAALLLAAGSASAGHSLALPSGAQVTVHGTTALMRANGETGTFSCSCSKGSGACTLTRGPTSIICDTSATGGCTGECVIVTGTKGVVGSAARSAVSTGAAAAARAQ
jgi:hypothetical protein